jgi:hypothetical protein
MSATINLDDLILLPPTPEETAAIAAYDAETARRAQIAAARTSGEPCPRCNGTGHIHAFRHIAKGDCFACGGFGRI